MTLGEKRLARLREFDPNTGVKDPIEYTLTGHQGRYPASCLRCKGKVIVMDFWATWCGPCRVQQPLYEEVKKRFEDKDDVIFLAINTDENTSVVKPFLETQQMEQDGLLRRRPQQSSCASAPSRQRSCSINRVKSTAV